MTSLRTLCAAGVICVSLVSLAAQAPSGLQRLLEAELARFPGRAGVWVKHLTTTEEAGVLADETFNSASVIKIPVMVLAYQMAEKGQLSLDERSEERRVGKECRSRWSQYHENKKER